MIKLNLALCVVLKAHGSLYDTRYQLSSFELLKEVTAATAMVVGNRQVDDFCSEWPAVARCPGTCANFLPVSQRQAMPTVLTSFPELKRSMFLPCDNRMKNNKVSRCLLLLLFLTTSPLPLLPSQPPTRTHLIHFHLLASTASAGFVFWSLQI